MKKIIAVFLLLALMISNSFALTNEITLEVDNINISKELKGLSSELKVQKIAELLMEEQFPENFKNFEEAVKFSNEFDKQLMNEFNNLSVFNKYDVIDTIRSNKKVSTISSEVDNAISAVMQDLKKDNIFILDLEDKEIHEKLNEKISGNSTKAVQLCFAQVRTFDKTINYAVWNPNGTRTYSYSAGWSGVRTGVNDDLYICDTELWFLHNKQNVWAVYPAARTIINSFYGRKLSYRLFTYNQINIVIGIKALILGYSPQDLQNSVVIW